MQTPPNIDFHIADSICVESKLPKLCILWSYWVMKIVYFIQLPLKNTNYLCIWEKSKQPLFQMLFTTIQIKISISNNKTSLWE